MKRGFTLIELLIVVAIIAILAAIAVPNFLEAQTRSKVSRAKADQRSLATAIQAYAVDNNRYPPLWNNSVTSLDAFFYNRTLYQVLASGNAQQYALRLTTPVSYITSVKLPDPFNERGQAFNSATSTIVTEAGYAAWMLDGQLRDPNYAGFWQSSYAASYNLLSDREVFVDGKAQQINFMLASPGPSQRWAVKFTGIIEFPAQYNAYAGVNGASVASYDPTNGTVSIGQIMRWE